jgi:hypothetical protein
MSEQARQSLIIGLNADKLAALGATPAPPITVTLDPKAMLETAPAAADETNHRDEPRQMLARWP